MLVGTGTNSRSDVSSHNMTVAMVHQKPVDRLLVYGANIYMIVQTTGCLYFAISASKKLGYNYVVC